MPQYMLLIYTRETPPAGVPAAEMSEWWDYTNRLKDAGALVAGDALEGPGAATVVRKRGGEKQVTDGPFVETTEYLGGYYVIECPDLDTALRWAEQMPNINYGAVEVRPLAVLSESPASAEQAQATA
jgi:hypothetical protein